VTRAVEGMPVIVIRNGRPVAESLRQQKLSESDLAVAARQQGIRDFGDVELAILEADGKVSFFQRENGDAVEGEDGAPETEIES
jgi:uncharacterized membrane protein YcaP (DUF421 family)